MNIFAPPVRYGYFVYKHTLYADPGYNNTFYPRATPAQLAALLSSDGLEPSKDKPWHLYRAQLIHYGLPGTTDKDLAKHRLQDALDFSKLEQAETLKLRSAAAARARAATVAFDTSEVSSTMRKGVDTDMRGRENISNKVARVTEAPAPPGIFSLHSDQLSTWSKVKNGSEPRLGIKRPLTGIYISKCLPWTAIAYAFDADKFDFTVARKAGGWWWAAFRLGLSSQHATPKTTDLWDGVIQMRKGPTLPLHLGDPIFISWKLFNKQDEGFYSGAGAVTFQKRGELSLRLFWVPPFDTALEIHGIQRDGLHFDNNLNWLWDNFAKGGLGRMGEPLK